MKLQRNKQSRLTIQDSGVYLILMIFTAVASAYVFMFFRVPLRLSLRDELHIYGWIIEIGGVLSCLILESLVPFFYFRHILPDNIPRSDKGVADRNYIWIEFKYLVVYPEILRGIFACIPTFPGDPLGYRCFDGHVSLIPNILFSWIYMGDVTRDISEIHGRHYSFLDNIVFVLYYILYLAVHLLILYLLFKHEWRRAEKKRDSYEKKTMDPEQMK